MQHKPQTSTTMTQQEFETRAIAVSADEFERINAMYMESELDKDQFCKVWRRLNPTRVKTSKRDAARENKQREIVWNVGRVGMSLNNLPYRDYDVKASAYLLPWQRHALDAAHIDYSSVNVGGLHIMLLDYIANH